MRNRKEIENELIPKSTTYLAGVDRYANDIKGLKRLLSLGLEVLLDIRALLGRGDEG